MRWGKGRDGAGDGDCDRAVDGEGDGDGNGSRDGAGAGFAAASSAGGSGGGGEVGGVRAGEGARGRRGVGLDAGLAGGRCPRESQNPVS